MCSVVGFGDDSFVISVSACADGDQMIDGGDVVNDRGGDDGQVPVHGSLLWRLLRFLCYFSTTPVYNAIGVPIICGRRNLLLCNALLIVPASSKDIPG